MAVTCVRQKPSVRQIVANRLVKQIYANIQVLNATPVTSACSFSGLSVFGNYSRKLSILQAFGDGSVAQQLVSRGTAGGFLAINITWGLGVSLAVWVSGGVSGRELDKIAVFISSARLCQHGYIVAVASASNDRRRPPSVRNTRLLVNCQQINGKFCEKVAILSKYCCFEF